MSNRDAPATVRPSALRLSTILTQLGQDAVPELPVEGPAAQGPPTESDSVSREGGWARRRRRPRVRSNITIGEMLDRTRHAGFGFIAALLALIAIPFMGLSTPFGLAVAFLGAQMTAGLPRPWLPQRVRRHNVSMATLRWLGERLARWTGGLERVTRPRFTFMAEGPFWTACGVGLVLQGLGLALPLPIPGSNWLFVVPVVLYGVALLECDGLLIMVCHTITAIQVALGIWLWDLILHGLRQTVAWVTGLVS